MKPSNSNTRKVQIPSKQQPDICKKPLAPIWRLLVDCRDEADQKTLYEALTSAGRKCRVLSL